jgi:integrase
LAPGSVNDKLKIIRQMFKTASRRFKIESPAHFVPGVWENTAQAGQRRAFTLSEIGRILRTAQGSEWEGIILAGLYTGQRLSDLAMLRWENVDLARGEIALTTRKTNRRILIPIAALLLDYLLKVPASRTKTPLRGPFDGDRLRIISNRTSKWGWGTSKRFGRSRRGPPQCLAKFHQPRSARLPRR